MIALALPANVQTAPPPPATFRDQSPEGCIPQAGPISDPAQGISGSTQRQIEQRLDRLRCEGSDDPSCAGVGGAAADINVGGGVVVVLPDGIVPFINHEAELANYLQQTHTVTGLIWSRLAPGRAMSGGNRAASAEARCFDSANAMRLDRFRTVGAYFSISLLIL